MQDQGRGHGPDHAVKVKVLCPGHEHELCVRVQRQVPPELRCSLSVGGGVDLGGSSCLPADLSSRVEHELRDNFQQTLRRGEVLIRL